jgi:hypothetical protein
MEVGQSTASTNKSDMGIPNKNEVLIMRGPCWDSTAVLERSKHIGFRDAKVRTFP